MNIITKNNNCNTSSCNAINGVLLKRNLLGEFSTSYEKEQVKKNLGIDYNNIAKIVLKNQDFINISNTYNIKNISLLQAIKYIPPKYRKEGQIITFIDEDNKWVMYQFVGQVPNQWNNITLWENISKLQFINGIIPDNEDLQLTSPDHEGNSKIKFKDRLYEPNEYSGKGYKILRKNIVEIDSEISHNPINYLYQDLLSQPNIIYEIRYDFDLNNQTITIPDNSVLYFNGGSINNGTININNSIKILNLQGNCIINGYSDISGLFENRPKNPIIGQQYFCTDKQTLEGDSNGIIIYYKGNNTWVDALGRTIK